MAEIRVVAEGFERVKGLSPDTVAGFLRRRLTTILVNALASSSQPIGVTVSTAVRKRGDPVILIYHPPGVGDPARFEHIADLARSRLRSLDALTDILPGIEFILDDGAGSTNGGDSTAV